MTPKPWGHIPRLLMAQFVLWSLSGLWGQPAWGQAVWPALDVNRADVARLDALPGIGLKRAIHIVNERRLYGPFADWTDLVERIEGLGPRSAAALSRAGLTVNGTGYHPAPEPANTRVRPRPAPLTPGTHTAAMPCECRTQRHEAPRRRPPARAARPRHPTPQDRPSQDGLPDGDEAPSGSTAIRF